MNASSLAGPAGYSRFCGAMVGLALGDALGAGYENAEPPVPLAPELFQPGMFGTAAGAPTDDTQLACAAAQSLAATALPGWVPDPVARRHFAAAYTGRVIAWAAQSPTTIGRQTAAAVRAWEAGRPVPGGPAAGGNGPVMAVAPIGLRWAGRPRRAATWARHFAEMTHPHPDPAAAAAAVAATIAELVAGHPVDAAARAAALGLPPRTSVHARDRRGWATLTATVALTALARAATPELAAPALLSVIELGGDTDTNAAVAGALLGARHGMRAWPPALLAPLAARESALESAHALWYLATRR